jgi:hypothetical protein
MITTQHKITSYTPVATKIVSNTSGRLRLRVAPGDRQPEKIQHIANFLAAQPDIIHVKTNIDHGSILIYHHGTAGSYANIEARLRNVGIFLTETNQGNTVAATGVRNAVSQLNQRVERATNGTVDLGLLFPLALSILAVRQLTIKGLQLDIIPWYVLAWYAFDSFLKLNPVEVTGDS